MNKKENENERQLQINVYSTLYYFMLNQIIVTINIFGRIQN